MLEKHKVKEDTIELTANQMYDKITVLINERGENYGGANVVEPIRNYDYFDLDDNFHSSVKVLLRIWRISVKV